MSAHDYCPGHAVDGSDAPTGDASDLRAIECPVCTPHLADDDSRPVRPTEDRLAQDRLAQGGLTEGGVTLIAALGGDTTINPTPPEGMSIAACAPTDDPAYWRTIQECDATCHHPIHAFRPGRRRHLIPIEDALRYRHEPLRD